MSSAQVSKKTRSQLRDVETLLFLNQISEVSVSYLWIWVQEIAVLRGVYRVSGKEVTLHTISGNLYVYRSLIALDRRIGDFVPFLVFCCGHCSAFQQWVSRHRRFSAAQAGEDASY